MYSYLDRLAIVVFGSFLHFIARDLCRFDGFMHVKRTVGLKKRRDPIPL